MTTKEMEQRVWEEKDPATMEEEYKEDKFLDKSRDGNDETLLL
jgi:hypothetical protein